MSADWKTLLPAALTINQHVVSESRDTRRDGARVAPLATNLEIVLKRLRLKIAVSGSNYIKLASYPLRPVLKQMLKDGEMSFFLGNI